MKMIENAVPDDFWYDVLSEEVDNHLSNFSEKDWENLIKFIPLENKDKNYCLFESISNTAPHKIFAKCIDAMIDFICNDTSFLWAFYNRVSKEVVDLLNPLSRTKLRECCEKELVFHKQEAKKLKDVIRYF